MSRFITLYSGSSGNCSVIEHNGKFVMVDLGGSCKATLGALVQVGLSPKDLAGILVTHEHTDHSKGLRVFLKKVNVPVFGTSATLGALLDDGLVASDSGLVAVDDGEEIGLCGLVVRGFATSHDSAGCCGWRFETAQGTAAAIATDLGYLPPSVFGQFDGVALAALEANYDAEMLRCGPYPRYLKSRIASATGHLDNREAAFAVARLLAGGTEKVVLCHLSAENNHPDLARKAVADSLYENGVNMRPSAQVRVAPRYRPGEWMEW